MSALHDEPVASRPADDLWEWVTALVCSDIVTSKTDRIIAVGWFIAKSGTGTSGTDCGVAERDLAALGVSRPTLYRYVRRLVTAGWLVRTTTPTRGVNGEPGRQARYQLQIPTDALGYDAHLGYESSLTAERDDETRPESESSLTAERDDETRPEGNRVSHLAESCLTSRGIVSHDHAGLRPPPTSDAPTSDAPTSVGDSGRQAQSVDARGSSPRPAESVPREDEEPIDRVGETDGWTMPGPDEVSAHADDARARIRAGAASARQNDEGGWG